jgi:hypothetical protein
LRPFSYEGGLVERPEWIPKAVIGCGCNGRSVAAFSKFHFLRQFSALSGISVRSYVQLNRLKRAVYRLAFRGEHSITAIALDSGYELVPKQDHQIARLPTKAMMKAIIVGPSQWAFSDMVAPVATIDGSAKWRPSIVHSRFVDPPEDRQPKTIGEIHSQASAAAQKRKSSLDSQKASAIQSAAEITIQPKFRRKFGCQDVVGPRLKKM